MSVNPITGESFKKEVLESERPVLLDFWASWCGPCRMLSPVVEEIAAENPGVKVCSVDVDSQPELANQFGVMSIPTLIVFKNGAQTAQSVGVQPKEKILEMLK